MLNNFIVDTENDFFANVTLNPRWALGVAHKLIGVGRSNTLETISPQW